MDVSTRKACFEEISHRICDSDLKVSINDISSHWKVNLRDSEALLLDWCAKHSSTAVTKEFLIRGVDAQGHCVISVVPEERLDAARQLFPQFCSSLFSVELPSTSERLGVRQRSSGVVINLPLDGKVRAARAQTANVVTPKPAAVKDEKKEVKPSMFGAKKATVEVKTSPPKPKESPAKAVKVEAMTPKKVSPKKSLSKTPSTKSSIASFFGKPSAAPPKAASKPVKEDVKEEVHEDEPMEEESEITMGEPEEEIPKKETPVKKDHKKSPAPANKKSRKRSVADTQDTDEEENGIPATPQQSNKRVRKDKSANKTIKPSKKATKHVASSDEDIPGTPEPKKADKKEPRFRRIVDSDSEDETPAAEATAVTGPKRRKAKRTVTRMYEDENGFMLSVKEIEEYTCSEDESGEPLKTSPPVEKPSTAATENIPPKKNHAKTPPKSKKITPPKAGNKQGSILSFFSKK